MTYIAQGFTNGERLKASKMTALGTNINEVRKTHIDADSPAEAALGVKWVDNSSNPFRVYQYDGAEWVHLFNVNTSSHQAAHAIFPENIEDGSINSDSVQAGSIYNNKLQNGLATPTNTNSNTITSDKIATGTYDDISVDINKFSISNGSIVAGDLALQEASSSTTSTGSPITLVLSEGSLFPAIGTDDTGGVRIQSHGVSSADVTSPAVDCWYVDNGKELTAEWYYLDTV